MAAIEAPLLQPHNVQWDRVKDAREDDLDKVAEKYEKMKIWNIVLQDYMTRRQLLRLDFVSNALADHAAQIRGDKVKIQVFLRWFRVAREMVHVTDLPFDVMASLHLHLETIVELQPMPTGQVVKSMLDQLQKAKKEHVIPGVGRTLLKMAFCEEKEPEFFDQHVAAAKEFAGKEMDMLLATYGKYPICDWFLKVLKRAATAGKYGLQLIRNQWAMPMTDEWADNMPTLAWTLLANRLDTAIVENMLTVEDCQAVPFPAAEPLREALLVYLWKITNLKSAMSGNVDQAKEFKAKVVAGLVTAGIPAIQFVTHKFASGERFGANATLVG